MGINRLIFTSIILGICTLTYSQDLQSPLCRWEYISMVGDTKNCSDFEEGDWQLVFSDEFDGANIDRSKWWTLEDGWATIHGDELEYYKDQNVTLENGLLKLTAKKESVQYNGTQYNYTSGWLQTKMKFKYGLFEIRCKIPSGQGLWPAFWLFGLDENQVGNEMDIFEIQGQKPDVAHITLHLWTNGNDDKCGSDSKTNDLSNDFHIFSAEWDDYKIAYRIDGIIRRIDYRFFNLSYQGLYDCQHFVPGIYEKNLWMCYPQIPAYVIINLAVGGGWVGNPDASTIFPSTLEVDYIHIFKRKNPNRDINLCNIDYSHESSFVTGKSIVLADNSCSSIIENGKYLNLFASDKVNLLPGFKADPGSFFTANIMGSNLKSTDESDFNKNNLFQSMNLTREPYKIYPNPTDGIMTIELNENISEFEKVEIMDINGFVVSRKFQDSDNIITLDLSRYNKGVYVIRMIYKEMVYITKVINQ